MLSIHHTAMGLSSRSSAIIVVLVLASLWYVSGWRRVQRVLANAAWRLVSFLLGVWLVWAALGSPLSTYDHDLLTIHMIQHLLLMTFAPALILLGEPLLVFWHGWPRLGTIVLGPLFRRPFVRRFTRLLSQPALCWTVSALTLLAWHVPAFFTLAMHSEALHFVEQAW